MSNTVGPSLWERIPLNIRLALVPLLTTALFVQSGANVAQSLACLSQGTWFCKSPNAQSSTDILGLLLLVNFVVAFVFTSRALGSALEAQGRISVDVKAIGLASPILSSVEFCNYALKANAPERIVFVLPILFFMFFVPF